MPLQGKQRQNSESPSIAISSLCSGLDWIMPLLHTMARLMGMTSHQVTRCELCPKLTQVATEISGPSSCNFKDIFKAETYQLPIADVLLAGFSCKSVSSANNRRRDITEANTRNALCSTGATWSGVRNCIQKQHPKFILLENVLGILRPLKSSDKNEKAPRRNIDVVLDDLNSLGYVAGTLVLDSSRFGTPQRRRRTYVSFRH